MHILFRINFILFCAIIVCSCDEYQRKDPLIGSWAFSLPDSKPVWLKITSDTTVSLLWSVGSAKNVDITSYRNNTFNINTSLGWRPFGKPERHMVNKPIEGTLDAENNLVLRIVLEHDGDEEELILTGKRMPPIPAHPNIEDLKFGEPINLLANGMDEWILVNNDKLNGWRFEDSILINETPKTDFSAYGNYGNLRSIAEFYDFELQIEYNAPVKGNSGIYLRGTYEVQVVDRDSPMQGIQGPGAVYGRIKPSVNAANAGGAWNKYRLLLVDRHITVELNGEVVIDNQPLEGCTGGGINSDDTKPGPIFLQGDHTSVKYRNIILREVL